MVPNGLNAYHFDQLKQMKWNASSSWCRYTNYGHMIIFGQSLGGFYLHFLVFPFVYQFNSRIEALVCSSLANDKFRRISTSFGHHFKICLLWLLHEKECSFSSYLFCCTKISLFVTEEILYSITAVSDQGSTKMRCLFISSSAICVTGSDTGSVASRASGELTSSKCEWTRIWTI